MSVALYGPNGWARGADAGTLKKVCSAGEILAKMSYWPELSADPAPPAEGHYTIWMSDGTESGDDGDIMCAITAGGITKILTLVDFSGGLYGGDVVIQMAALQLASSAQRAYTQPVNMQAAILMASAEEVSAESSDVTVLMNALTLAGSTPSIGVQPMTKVTLPYREIQVAAPAITYIGATTAVTMDTLALTSSAGSPAVIQHAAAMDSLSAALSAPSLTVVVAAQGVGMGAASAAASAPKLAVYAPEPGSTAIHTDSFTDTPYTNLNAHTPELGNGYTKVAGVGTMQIAGDGAHVSCTGLSGYTQYKTDPGEHARQIKVDWYAGNQFYQLRIIFRGKDSDDFLCVYIYPFGSDYDIQKSVTGGFTTLATSSPSISATTWYTMWIEDNPSTNEIKVYHTTRGNSKPGSAQVTVTDSTWSGYTEIGFRPQTSNDKFDELKAWSTVYE